MKPPRNRARRPVMIQSVTMNTLRARLTAKMHAGRLDRLLAVGFRGPLGSALAVHADKLTSAAERESVARTLRQAVHDAHYGRPARFLRGSLHREGIVDAADLIDDVAFLLQSADPVSPRGVARLRQLLSDGRGPLYRSGRGDLEGRLGAALAAM